MADNLYQDLKNILQEFKDFLQENVATIKPAIQALTAAIPQLSDLLDQLKGLMNSLKTEITNLNVSGIPGLSQVSEFTQMITSLLQSARGLLPDLADDIDHVLEVAAVVGSLPSLDQVKDDILELIDAIIADLNQLTS